MFRCLGQQNHIIWLIEGICHAPWPSNMFWAAWFILFHFLRRLSTIRSVNSGSAAVSPDRVKKKAENDIWTRNSSEAINNRWVINLKNAKHHWSLITSRLFINRAWGQAARTFRFHALVLTPPYLPHLLVRTLLAQVKPTAFAMTETNRLLVLLFIGFTHQLNLAVVASDTSWVDGCPWPCAAQRHAAQAPRAKAGAKAFHRRQQPGNVARIRLRHWVKSRRSRVLRILIRHLAVILEGHLADLKAPKMEN